MPPYFFNYVWPSENFCKTLVVVYNCISVAFIFIFFFYFSKQLRYLLHLKCPHMSALITSWAYWRSHLSTSMCSESIQEVRVRTVRTLFKRCPKYCTKKSLQKVNLLHIELELRGVNYQTPFYADCILKYGENCHKIYFLIDNSFNFKAFLKSDILKQI